MNKILVLFGFLILLASPAYAGIPVDSGDYTGSRSTPPGSGVSSTGGYLQENGGFKIAWDISFDGTYWNYSYTVTNADGTTVSPDVSHWILEISPEVDFDNIDDYIFDANATVATPPNQGGGDYYWPKDPNFPTTSNAGANNGNPNLGANLTGIKFDTNSGAVSGVYTFKSVEPPVWGDFYIK
jgi:hypothetical protein